MGSKPSLFETIWWIVFTMVILFAICVAIHDKYKSKKKEKIKR